MGSLTLSAACLKPSSNLPLAKLSKLSKTFQTVPLWSEMGLLWFLMLGSPSVLNIILEQPAGQTGEGMSDSVG